jgi:hypothetical protein
MSTRETEFDAIAAKFWKSRRSDEDLWIALRAVEALASSAVQPEISLQHHEEVTAALRGDIARLRAQVAPVQPEPVPLPDAAPSPDFKALYYELLLAVGHKYPGESRHETAMRYIRRAEQSGGPASSASPAPKETT